MCLQESLITFIKETLGIIPDTMYDNNTFVFCNGNTKSNDKLIYVIDNIQLVFCDYCNAKQTKILETLENYSGTHENQRVWFVTSEYTRGKPYEFVFHASECMEGAELYKMLFYLIAYIEIVKRIFNHIDADNTIETETVNIDKCTFRVDLLEYHTSYPFDAYINPDFIYTINKTYENYLIDTLFSEVIEMGGKSRIFPYEYQDKLEKIYAFDGGTKNKRILLYIIYNKVFVFFNFNETDIEEFINRLNIICKNFDVVSWYATTDLRMESFNITFRNDIRNFEKCKDILKSSKDAIEMYIQQAFKILNECELNSIPKVDATNMKYYFHTNEK